MSYLAVPVAIAKWLEECRMEIISMVARLTQFVKEPVTSRNLFSRKTISFCGRFQAAKFRELPPSRYNPFIIARAYFPNQFRGNHLTRLWGFPYHAHFHIHRELGLRPERIVINEVFNDE